MCWFTKSTPPRDLPNARPIGSAGQNTSATTNAAASAVATAQQAAAATQQSMQSLTRATQAIQAMQAMQNAARNAALSGPNNLGADPNHPGLYIQTADYGKLPSFVESWAKVSPS